MVARRSLPDIKIAALVLMTGAFMVVQHQRLHYRTQAGSQRATVHFWTEFAPKMRLSAGTQPAIVQRPGINSSRLSATCAAQVLSKQSCLFSNVCLKQGPHDQLNIILPGPSSVADRKLLLRHLGSVLNGTFHVTIANQTAAVETSIIWDEHYVTVVWKPHKFNQDSFGHAMVNEAFPLFQVLQNHFDDDIPASLQVLLSVVVNPVLLHVLKGTSSNSTSVFHERLQRLQATSADTLCFGRLLLGDGGYIAASRASISNSQQQEAKLYSIRPSFFASHDWWEFRRHALQVAGVAAGPPAARPVVLLNDKRYGPNATADRRMISNVDALAAAIQAAYPDVDVVVTRFRDAQWSEQLKLLSRAQVFITTQGSSAFRLVFLPRGSTCIMIGAPEPPGTVWKSFHELDKWFALTYVHFIRYTVAYANVDDYKVNVVPGHWQPGGTEAARHWWLYNADVVVNFTRLQPMLDQALTKQLQA